MKHTELIARFRLWRYERRMARVLEEISKPTFCSREKLLETFRSVNGIEFDPFNRWHVDTASRAMTFGKLAYIASTPLHGEQP